MKKLVVYYSSTGNTRKVAEDIASKLDCDIDIIVDKNNVGENVKEKFIEIDYKKAPSKYDMVIIGTPVWAFNIPPAIRTYLDKNSFNKVAFFSTCGLIKGFVFSMMKKYSKNKPLAKMCLRQSELKKTDKTSKKINKFIKDLNL